MAKTADALQVLERLTGKSTSLRLDIANARVNLEVAQMIYDARTKAGLSQRELAERIGSKQSVIARLEDADYRGHSLSMLQRLGNALGRKLELRFVKANRRGPRRAGELPGQNECCGMRDVDKNEDADSSMSNSSKPTSTSRPPPGWNGWPRYGRWLSV